MMINVLRYVRLNIALLIVVFVLVTFAAFSLSVPTKAYADARTSDIPTSLSGRAYIEDSWMVGSQSYFNVSGFTGRLSNYNWHNTFECKNHTAAEPNYVWGDYEATYNNCSYSGGWVEYYVLITPPDATDGYTSNEYGLIGYQRVGGYVRIPWTFTYSLDVNWRLDKPTGGYTDSNSSTDYGRCSVKLGGTVKGTDVADFNQSAVRGTSYQIYNVKSVKTGYVYKGVCQGALSGTLNANTAVRLEFRPINYFVKYNANGGVGTMANSSHKYDLAANLSKNAFMRTTKATFDSAGGSNNPAAQTPSWAFNKWTTNANGSGSSFTNQASTKNLTATDNATVNLYAQWTAPTITLPDPGTRAGWVFKGWFDGENRVGGTGDKYVLSTNKNLVAKWNPLVSYVVDKDETFLTVKDEVPYKTAFTVPASNTQAATRTDCHHINGEIGFDGWYLDAEYTQKWVDGTVVDKPTILYARNWATLTYANGKGSDISDIYSANGVTGGVDVVSGTPSASEYPYGTIVNLDEPTQKRLLYDGDGQFPQTIRATEGWHKAWECSDASFGDFALKSDTTLYKLWESSIYDGITSKD